MRAPGLAFVKLALVALLPLSARAADHADMPGKYGITRFDANLLNFYAFTAVKKNKTSLVMAAQIDNSIPETLADYWFASDLTVEFHIDKHSSIIRTEGSATPSVDDKMMRFGGTIVDPGAISEDIIFRITFEPSADGRTVPKLSTVGLPALGADEINLFPAPGESALTAAAVRNVAAVVVEVPLDRIVDGQSTILLWATTQVPDVARLYTDHMGLPSTSNRPANIEINYLHPRDQAKFLVTPVSEKPRADVMIFDTAKLAQFPPSPFFTSPPFDPSDPSTFPNGRPLDPIKMNKHGKPQFPYIAKPFPALEIAP